MEQLIHDAPTSAGMANVLKRGAQHSSLRWTPIAKGMPRTAKIKIKDGIPYESNYVSWRPQFGLPYSSVRYEEKFIGFNVSLETWFSALSNPKSVLYTRSLIGKGPRMSCWYGSVCSVFVAHAFGLPTRRVCRTWGDFGDMTKVEVKSAQDIHLCDILCNDHHVVFVSDVARTPDGRVAYITVSECTPPQIVALANTAEEFEHAWLSKYEVWQYKYIDSVPYEPTPYLHLAGDPDLKVPPLNRSFMTDYGNKANYRLGESVEFNVMEEGWEQLRVTDESGATVFSSSIEGPGVIAFKPAERGFYTASCLKKDGSKSLPLEFAVTAFTLHAEEKDGGIFVRYDAHPDDRILMNIASLTPELMEVRYNLLSEQESADRTFFLPGPFKAGTYKIKALAGNRFGQYSTPDFHLTIK